MPAPAPYVFRHEAMATWFEIRVAGGDRDYARQAAEEGFRLIDHLEELLSRYREDSEVSAIAKLEAGQTLTLSVESFECLALALEMSELTGGAFDPALGHVMDSLRQGQSPAVNERGTLLLDPTHHAVACAGQPVAIDLGAIGKGYALDCVSELLAEWEVGPALLVGGGSSILAVGESEHAWEVGITSSSRVLLRQGSVGCSGLSVKGAHILDPRTGTPAATPARAWALSAKAAVSDALSTAFMILPADGIEEICAERPEAGALIQPAEDSPEVLRIGRALGVHYGFERLGPDSR